MSLSKYDGAVNNSSEGEILLNTMSSTNTNSSAMAVHHHPTSSGGRANSSFQASTNLSATLISNLPAMTFQHHSGLQAPALTITPFAVEIVDQIYPSSERDPVDAPISGVRIAGLIMAYAFTETGVMIIRDTSRFNRFTLEAEADKLVRSNNKPLTVPQLTRICHFLELDELRRAEERYLTARRLNNRNQANPLAVNPGRERRRLHSMGNMGERSQSTMADPAADVRVSSSEVSRMRGRA